MKSRDFAPIVFLPWHLVFVIKLQKTFVERKDKDTAMIGFSLSIDFHLNSLSFIHHFFSFLQFYFRLLKHKIMIFAMVSFFKLICKSSTLIFFNVVSMWFSMKTPAKTACLNSLQKWFGGNDRTKMEFFSLCV